jgi:hypothetical protein
MQITGYSCQILIKFEFLSRDFRKTQISKFIKIHPVGAELFHVNRFLDRRTKLIIYFRNFADTPKKRQNAEKLAVLTLGVRV